jgi:hypothetical protein
MRSRSFLLLAAVVIGLSMTCSPPARAVGTHLTPVATPARQRPPQGNTPATPAPAPTATSKGWLEQITDALGDNDLIGALVDLGPPAIHALAAFAALAMTWLCCQPIQAFIQRGWRIKREDVMSSLDDDSKAMYLIKFQNKHSANPSAEFEAMYEFRYGRYRLWMPLTVLILVTFPLTFILAETAMGHLLLASGGRWHELSANRQFDNLIAYPPAAAAAVAGAYAWTVATFIAGATRYTLPPGLVATGALRIAIAAPLGYAVTAFLGRDHVSFAPAVAFGLGAFPLDTIQLLFRRIFNRLGLDIGTTDDKRQVTQLDGVDRVVADRLSDADISTIAQLAHCDPVQTSMRTNLDFDVVTDAQGQALAWLYLGEDLGKIRAMGMRGAMEIGNLLGDLRSTDPARLGPATEAFNDIANKLASPSAALIRAFQEIGEDPYTQFLSKVWANLAARGTPPEAKNLTLPTVKAAAAEPEPAPQPQPA